MKNQQFEREATRQQKNGAAASRLNADAGTPAVATTSTTVSAYVCSTTTTTKSDSSCIARKRD